MDDLSPLKRSSKLTNYYPLPRGIIGYGLPTTAILLYCVILDRALLSAQNGWSDASGNVYVIYTIESLAATIGVSTSVIKRHLDTLSRCGMIDRKRPIGNRASHIYVRVPADSIRIDDQSPIAPLESSKMPQSRVQKRSTSNHTSNMIVDNYYQQTEEQCL